MDMAIFKIETKKQKITFAGANLPAYFISEIEPEFNPIDKVKLPKTQNELSGAKLYELRPDKMPIAFYYNMEKFTKVSFNYANGDMIYLFSDGYIDQFGGKDGKKFKTKAFKKLLLDISVLNADNQYKILHDTFFSWKKDNEQIDDVTVLGLRL
jgi:serine phosphatase RsbU (regulator of sigma subunit)